MAVMRNFGVTRSKVDVEENMWNSTEVLGALQYA